MAKPSRVKARLAEYGFTVEHWQRAVRFYDDRGFWLRYGGRGRFRGMFHVSRVSGTGVVGRINWEALRAYDPTTMLDAPSTTMKEFAKKGA